MQARGERFSLEILHDEELNAVLLADVAKGTDVRMVEARERFGLLCESLLRARSTIAGAEHLDRDESAHACIARSIDLAHATCAQSALDLIGTDACATLEGHGVE